jgi:hypothetical protein
MRDHVVASKITVTNAASAAFKASLREGLKMIKNYEKLTGDSYFDMLERYEAECPEAGEVTIREAVAAAEAGHRGWDVFRVAARDKIGVTGRSSATPLPARRPTAPHRRGQRAQRSRRTLSAAGSRGDPDEPSDDAKPGNRANIVWSESEIRELLRERERAGGRTRPSITCGYCSRTVRGNRKTILGSTEDGIASWWQTHECRAPERPPVRPTADWRSLERLYEEFKFFDRLMRVAA